MKRSSQEEFERSIDQWASDSSLYHRLRDSVLALCEGAGSFGQRANYAIERLRPITIHDFPDELKPIFQRIRELDQASFLYFSDTRTLLRTSRLSPKNRKMLSHAIFNLYEEMLKARVRRGMED